MNLIRYDPNTGGPRPPSKAVVFRFILQACERFGFAFSKPSRAIADAVQEADYDELANLAFLGMGDNVSEETFRDLCADLGLE